MSYLGNQKSVQELTDYEVWRDRFLRDRLRPAVGRRRVRGARTPSLVLAPPRPPLSPGQARVEAFARRREFTYPSRVGACFPAQSVR